MERGALIWSAGREQEKRRLDGPIALTRIRQGRYPHGRPAGCEECHPGAAKQEHGQQDSRECACADADRSPIAGLFPHRVGDRRQPVNEESQSPDAGDGHHLKQWQIARLRIGGRAIATQEQMRGRPVHDGHGQRKDEGARKATKALIQYTIGHVGDRERQSISETGDGAKWSRRKEVAPGERQRHSADQHDRRDSNTDGLGARKAQDEDRGKPGSQRQLGVDGAEGQ